MALWKKILLGIAAVAAAILGFTFWYATHYSMRPARQFDVNSPAANARVLIATQGSDFKDSVVAAPRANMK